MAQKVHPKITEVSTVSHMVRHHVNNDLCKDDKPTESDSYSYLFSYFACMV